jgi:SAM-dependent methyltransferase
MHVQEAPAAWFVRHAGLISAGSNLLDVACGYGRHARYFAARGVSVTAVDRDADALAACASCAGVNTERRDLEADSWPYAAASFAAVIVSNYLWRPTLSDLLATVDAGGVLLYETFMDGNERYGRPSRPEFLLRSNELRMLVQTTFRVVAYEEGEELDANGRPVAVKQKLAAVRR